DPEIVRRLHELDPARISARDVAEVLARVPAPRIILLEGSVPLVNMDPFAEFLIAMGYPADRIRNPRDGRYSESSFIDSEQLAGMVAWYYEREGMRPVLIGHSQGGMLAIRVLYDLAGAFSDAIHVWNPLTDRREPRTTIVDPVTGDVRPVVGLRVRYAAAIATGKLPRLLLGQWSMLSRLRKIPDSVDDFTGFSLDWDLIAGHFGSSEPYTAIGTANVRNVTLPVTYTHIGLPRTEHLSANAAMRAWIDAYVPGTKVAVPADPGIDTTNLIHAADIWYSVKKNWCLSARRRLDAAHLAR
ncbi:MAG TPA: hypothetical protein VFJ48_05890, partial [Casimicrobiaceae bacterium]|nr:hypothetical protein [Casimicrobiaceae bacterium]